MKKISMAALENIVVIRNLSKIYAQGEIQVTALNSITLDIAVGEFLTLMVAPQICLISLGIQAKTVLSDPVVFNLFVVRLPISNL